MAGKLEGPDSEIRKNLPSNPKNSIQARVVTAGADRATQPDDLPVFWPLFPHDIMPLKEGEHAYVIFEDNGNRTHGLWVSRSVDSQKTEQLNLTPAEKKYKENPDNDTNDVGIDKATQDSDLEVSVPQVSPEFTKEEIPEFTARLGDRVIHGSNNTMILLSRDRIDLPDSGQKEGSGTIFLVAGRKDKENLNLKTDDSFIIISSKTDIDKNIEELKKVGDTKSGVPVVAISSDEIRVFAKKGAKIVVDDGDLYLYGKNVYHADKASNTESHVLGETLKKLLEELIDTINGHELITPAGPAPMAPLGIKLKTKVGAKLDTILSKTIKLKKN